MCCSPPQRCCLSLPQAWPEAVPGAGAEHGQALEEDDDDETCGFCIFMKAGGCRDEFNVRSHSCCVPLSARQLADSSAQLCALPLQNCSLSLVRQLYVCASSGSRL